MHADAAEKMREKHTGEGQGLLYREGQKFGEAEIGGPKAKKERTGKRFHDLPPLIERKQQ
jgi:hypothetical protein